MKTIYACLTVAASILVFAAGPVGCSDSDDNGGSSARVTAAYDDFCDYLLDCAEEDGQGEFDREEICPAFDGLIEAGRVLGPACERVIADYFDCLTTEPCRTDESSCVAPGEGPNTACGSAPSR